MDSLIVDTLAKLGEIVILCIAVFLLVRVLARFVELQSQSQKDIQKLAESTLTALQETNVQSQLTREVLSGLRRDQKRARVTMGQIVEQGSETLRLVASTHDDTKKLPETMALEIIKAMAPVLTEITRLTEALNANAGKTEDSRLMIDALSRTLGEIRVEFVGALDSMANEAANSPPKLKEPPPDASPNRSDSVVPPVE